MGAVANALQSGLGGADEAHDLRVLQLGMIADQPQNRVRAILTARQRGVTGAAALLGFRQAHFGDRKLELVIAALLAARYLVAG